MVVSFNDRVTVSPEVLISEVGNESVLLNLRSERYFGLDEIGTRMWKAFTSAETIQAAYESLLDEYEVEPELLRRDMSELIEKLLDQGLVEIAGE